LLHHVQGHDRLTVLRYLLLCLMLGMWPVASGQAQNAPPSPAIPDPATVSYAQCLDSAYMIGGKLCLWHCVSQGAALSCDLGFQWERNETWKNGKPFDGASITFTDNFRVDHNLTRVSWLNLKGQRMATATLGKGDWIWMAMDFAGGSNDITSGRIVIQPKGRGDTLSLTGSVQSTE
jgi:hypothetical protein